ncbi:MAG: NAD(P)H-hydrate dehydratase [Oscillospiraceae bacterium]|nr:NAD(P)H-hydrate dehydratase [Oscillospiraceae bacterium]MDD4413691.1 NAD(P)H-hydrate dehydratase [Oscillospiraceae bacterium]
MYILTTAQMRAVEKAAIDDGLGELRLMENAGSAAARIIRSKYSVSGRSVVVLCGKGNNGGDGFVIARKLLDEGANVKVVLTCGLPTSKSASEMLSRIKNSEIEIINLETEPYVAASSVSGASLIIDAVYGLGFHGNLPDNLRGFFGTVNSCEASLIAIDVPSGVNADTGDTDTDALKAELTITFTANKIGLTTINGAEFSGSVTVVSIGIDEKLLKPYLPDQTEINIEMVKSCFTQRVSDSSKGDYGRLLTLCGSRGMMGASIMAARAALRCGAGLVVYALPSSLYPIAAARLCEPVFCLLDETPGGDFALSSRTILREQAKTADAMLIGCGLGQSAGAASLVIDCIENTECPIILDADGINIMSGHINKLKAVRSSLVLTPHPGEMARLTGKSISQVQSDRMNTASQFADQTGAVVVLKGQHTVIACPGQQPLVNTTGNPGMATGGSGDVLAGMIASFIAQGMKPKDAAMCAVYLHGLAGDKAADKLSQHYILPDDIINELSGLFLILENRS